MKWMKWLGLVVLAVVASVEKADAQAFVRLQPVAATGSIAGDTEAVTIEDASQHGTLGIQVTGTFTGTLTPQCSLDGSTWGAVESVELGDSAETATTFTSTGLWRATIAGCRQVRVVGSSWESGTAVVTLNAVQSGGGGGGGGGTVSGDIEVGAQPADDPHYVRCSDGSAAGACAVDLSDEDKGKLDDIVSNTASIAAELSGDSAIPVCDATATTFTKNTTAAQQIIAASGSNIPVICAYSVDAEGTTDWKFVSGTGTNCGTGQSDISKNHAFSTTTGYIGETHGNGVGVVVSGISGEAICLVQSATAVTNFVIRYTYIAP